MANIKATWVDSADVLFGTDFMDALTGKYQSHGTFTLKWTHATVTRDFKATHKASEIYTVLTALAKSERAALVNSKIQAL